MQAESEVDVIVVGYGAAGGAAALTAHQHGAETLIIEKMAQPGGNSLVSSAMMIYPVDPAQAEQFATYLHEVTYGTTPRELVDTFVQGLLENPAWFESLGGELEVYDYKTVDPSISYYIPDKTFAQLPSAQGLQLHLRRLKQGPVAPQPTGGARIWHLIDKNVRSRGIQVWTDTPVKELVRDSWGTIIGVIARRDGRDIFCRARRGVVLTCGGFEYNEELKWQFLASKPIGALGSPGNTGDGIKMVQQVGAALWHMEAEASALGFRPPGYEAGFALTLRRPGFIYVDKHGRRFLDEARLEAHNAGVETAVFDLKTYDYSRLPSYLVMDQENAHGKRLAMNIFSYNIVVRGYEWSEDNSKEIEAGWIQKADSVAELARIIGTDEAAVAFTLMRYNDSCRQGVDQDFGRPQETLKPLLPPYYVMKLEPFMYNTQGGPRRDKEARVLDPEGKPIPHLFAAGEFGSIWGFRYQTSTNFSEAIVYGRIAGQNAAQGSMANNR
ncbi:hypothetical protein BHS06_04140 [Myxococcus xanthus]|nr:hypothetical protein BHS06_04140 [Myxococcus xanthus]